MPITVSVLCVCKNSSYYQIPGLDLWDEKKDAFNFSGRSPVIAHPPCPQWSRLRAFSNYNLKEKLLAEWCWEIVQANGGIFEHPSGSSFWKYINADRKKILSVDQCWWGFPARKRTYLYFNKCTWNEFPILQIPTVKELQCISSGNRSQSPLSFNQWLVDSCRNFTTT